MYIYIHIYVYIHTYICIHTYIHIYICVCVCVCVCKAENKQICIAKMQINFKPNTNRFCKIIHHACKSVKVCFANY